MPVGNTPPTNPATNALSPSTRLNKGSIANMSNIKSLFVTRLYQAGLSEFGTPIDADELENSCLAIAEDDEAGQDWCEENNFPGYTSYASLTDLAWRFPIFKDITDSLDQHVAAFAKDLDFDLDGRALKLEVGRVAGRLSDSAYAGGWPREGGSSECYSRPSSDR